MDNLKKIKYDGLDYLCGIQYLIVDYLYEIQYAGLDYLYEKALLKTRTKFSVKNILFAYPSLQP